MPVYQRNNAVLRHQQGDWVKRFMGALIIGAVAAASSAQSVKVDPHAELAAVLFAASATQAALAKSFDATLKMQQQRIGQRMSELKAGDNRHNWMPVIKPLALFEPAQGTPAKDRYHSAKPVAEA
jgi:hypothetical protein